jgi:hypothetical protein
MIFFLFMSFISGNLVSFKKFIGDDDVPTNQLVFLFTNKNVSTIYSINSSSLHHFWNLKISLELKGFTFLYKYAFNVNSCKIFILFNSETHLKSPTPIPSGKPMQKIKS